MSNFKGFSLIELMVVIAIAGILAAIAIPSYQNYIARAQVSEAMTITGGIRTEIANSFISKTGTFVGIDSSTNGIPSALEVRGNYVRSVSVVDGIVSVNLGNKVAEFLSGEVLTLTPKTTSGETIMWSCTFSGDTRFIPQSCR
jgi:type IV pilus assembly protein PilA